MGFVGNMRVSDACLDHFRARGQRPWVEVVSDGVRFRDEDMMDPAGLSTPTSQIKSEWRQSGKRM